MWVDGDGEDIAEVAAFFYLRCWYLVRYRFCFFLNGFRELERIFIFSEDRLHLDVVFAWIAKHFHDLAKRILGVVGPFCEMHDDLLSVFGAFVTSFRNEDAERHRRAVWHHECESVREAEDTDEIGLGALDDLDDLAFVFLALTLWKHRHFDLVAM